MTITAETYNEVNSKLLDILEEYKDTMTQYDVLLITVNLLVSYMEVLVDIDKFPKQKLFDEVVELIKTSDFQRFTPKK